MAATASASILRPWCFAEDRLDELLDVDEAL